MTRKSAKEFQIEYDDLKSQLKSIENRVAKRLATLCKEFPNAPIGTKADGNRTIIYAKDISNKIFIESLGFNVQLSYISTIEKWLVDQHPHKQTEINFPK